MLIISLVLLLLLMFVGLIFMLQRILNKNIISATKHIDELSQDYSKKEAEIARQLEEVKQKSQEILDKARAEAEKARNQMISDAQAESEKLVKHAQSQGEEMIKQADKTRQQLLTEIEDRISKEAVNKACELIQHVLPENFKQDIHAQWIGELIENGFANIERLRIAKDVQDVKIAAAYSLSKAQRDGLAKKLKEILGHDVALKEEIDPKVVAGITITIGSLVLDGSLKNRIREQAKILQQS
jgi:F0F1-type ATP synthase membrane subunit b/b'